MQEESGVKRAVKKRNLKKSTNQKFPIRNYPSKMEEK